MNNQLYVVIRPREKMSEEIQRREVTRISDEYFKEKLETVAYILEANIRISHQEFM